MVAGNVVMHPICRAFTVLRISICVMLGMGSLTTSFAQSTDLKETAARIAEDVGNVVEVYADSRNGAPIIIIGEEHLSRIGQFQVAVMLDRLYQRNGFRKIALEGMPKSSNPLDASWFHRLPNQQIREDVATRLLAEGEISSAEMMALVHSDIQVLGIEDASEYNFVPTDTRGDPSNDPTIVYMVGIAARLASPQQLNRFMELVQAGKQQEAIKNLIDSVPWTKEVTSRLLDAAQNSIGSSLYYYRQISDKARQLSIPIDVAMERNMQTQITILENLYQRSMTMAKNIVSLAQSNPSSPVVAIVGYTHVRDMINQHFLREDFPIIFIKPNSPTDRALFTSEQASRKFFRGPIQIYPGSLGAAANQLRKEPPRIEDPATKAYAAMEYAAIAVGDALRAGASLDNIRAALPSMPGVSFNASSFERDGDDLIFSANMLALDGKTREVWARVGVVRKEKESAKLENRLEEYINAFGQVENDTGVPGDYEMRNNGRKPLRRVARLNAEVFVVFGGTRGAVTAVGRTSIVGYGGINLPVDVQVALQEIERGETRPNVRNPKPFENDGRDATAMLPQTNASGSRITYTEYTVNPRPPGGKLDGKRIVIGSDGHVYYTGDHFRTPFQRLK
jgi:hypothetical protein